VIGVKHPTAALRAVNRGETLARNVILVMTGLGILCLSFWITVIVIDTGAEKRPSDVSLADVPATNEDGSPRSTRANKVSDLPAPPIVPTVSVGWDGIEGLNALNMGPGPTGGGNLALSLVATKDSGRHRLGIAFVGMPANRMVHATIWLKAPPGTRAIIEARDGVEAGRGARNVGGATFEISPPKILSSDGNVQAGIQAGPTNWVNIPVDMKSNDGVFVIYVGFLGPGNAPTFSGSGQQMIFGGIELTVS
jgi:hypothetical protein